MLSLTKVAISLCPSIYFFLIEKFNEKNSRSVAIGCIAFAGLKFLLWVSPFVSIYSAVSRPICRLDPLFRENHYFNIRERGYCFWLSPTQNDEVMTTSIIFLSLKTITA